MTSLLRDLRHAVRSLRRSPGFTGVALLTLALGTGANVAIFSVVHGVLLEPLPFAEPDRLVTVWLHNPQQGYDKDVTSYPNFEDWRRQAGAFSAMVGVRGTDVTLSELGAVGSSPEEVGAAQVTAGYLALLGVEPALGRGFRADEHAAGEQVVVLSHRLWSRRFGGDRSLVGKAVRVNGQPHTVVGVMPPGVRFPEGAHLWLPLAFQGPLDGLREARSPKWLPVFGRLAPGRSLEQAQAEMSAIARGLEQAYPDANRDLGVLLEPLQTTLVGDVTRPLLVLLGAVGLVLLIACANVANLLLARGAGRARELAVRSAMGASGAGLARRVLAESLALGAAGGLLGLAAGAAGVRGLLALTPGDLPRLENVALDWTVLGFALVVALGVGLLFGLPSALHAARVPPGATLREGGRGLVGGRRLGRVRQVFVAAQLALALMLLAGAGLLVRSFVALRSVDPGFEPQGVLSFRVTLRGPAYETPESAAGFYRELIGSLERLPGVESAAAISSFVLGRYPASDAITLEGRPHQSEADAAFPVAMDAVTPDFLAAAGVELLQGRPLAASDRADGMPVALVNEAFARRFFPGEDPVGRRFVFGSGWPEGEEVPWMTIVGVTADVRRSGLDQEVRPSAFLPHDQYSQRQMTVLMRTAGDPLALAEPARRAVEQLAPEQPITEVRTLEQLLAGTSARSRFVAVLLGLFAGLALTLAAIGLYGVMAHVAGQRTREIGIRLALGGRPRAVLGSMLGQGMAVVAVGVVLGLLGAVATTHLLSGLLFETTPGDPLTFILVVALLCGVALAANLLPARRAARVDPVTALRGE